MQKKKRWPRIILSVVVVAVAVVIIFQLNAKKTVTYSESTAKTGSLSTYYSFTGTLAAQRSQYIAAPQPAVVKEIYVIAGDRVKKDERLMKLSTGDILKADIAGEVTEISVHADDSVQAGTVLMTVADLDHLEVKLKADEYDVAAITLGTEVALSVPAIDVETTGTISALNKLATETPTNSYYTATVTIQAQPGMLPGMEVGVKLLKAKVENAVLLKADALKFNDDNTPYVLVMGDKGNVYAQAVTVGISDGSNVEIKEGLNAGVKVYYTDNSFDSLYALVQGRRGAK